MHDAARIRIERPDLLRDARRHRFLHQKFRHLSQLDVFAFSKSECVNHIMPIAARIAPKRGVDDHLQCVERLAFSSKQRVRALAADVQPHVVGRLLDRHVERQTHGLQHLLDEIDVFGIEICLCVHTHPTFFATPV